MGRREGSGIASTVGAGKQVKWPRGQGGKGNEGVAQVVEQTAGAIGYLEQNYADKNHIAYGLVQNKSGKFVKASPKSSIQACHRIRITRLRSDKCEGSAAW